MSRAARRADWVSLLEGVRVSRQWMAHHTPGLLDAWRRAATAERRREIAVHIIQVATRPAAEPDHDPAPPGDRRLHDLAQQVDPRLVRGPDWLPLAAALARAATAGYDVERRLPELAAAGLPAWHPGRELHWRLLEDCPAALPSAEDGPESGARPKHTVPDRPQKPDTRPTGEPAGTPCTADTPARSKGAPR